MTYDKAGRSALPLRLLVDLSHLLPGGANGGVKPFILEYLRWLGWQRDVPVQIIYLTASCSHAEIRELARFEDELICVRDDGTGCRPLGHERAPRERLWLDPPVDLAARVRTDVAWCPLGTAEFACPGVPTVATIVDVLHRDFPFTLSPPDNAFRERCFAILLAAADVFQCISAYTMERMHTHYGVHDEKMFCTHIAIQERLDESARDEGTKGGAAMERGTGTPFFFYPANAWVHKNHEVLLLAYNIYRRITLAAGQQPWRLVLTGHEDNRMRALRTLAETLGLEPAEAVFAGHVSTAQLRQLWGSAGVLVFPSLHEGFGIPLVEAMQSGVPVLCSEAGSLPEVGADACLYADARRPMELAKAMSRLAGDATLRQSLVEKGRARLRSFSLKKEAGEFLRQLSALAGRGSRPTARGVWPDGWTMPLAIFGLPPLVAGERCQLRIALRAMPAARRLSLFAGDRPLGSFDLSPGQRRELNVVFRADRGAVRLVVSDAHSLAPESDARPHGVALESLHLQRGDGARCDLLEYLLPA